MRERLIQKILYNYFTKNNKGKWFVCNTKSFGWESDFVSISANRMVYEYEIKVSKQDYKRDKLNKELKHKLLLDEIYPVNYFCYVVPENLIKAKEVHPAYGLIYITEREYNERIKADDLVIEDKIYNVKTIRKPKKLNKKPLSYEILVKALTTVMHSYYKTFLN